MSVLDQFGDDPRPILEVALEQATPNRISGVGTSPHRRGHWSTQHRAG